MSMLTRWNPFKQLARTEQFGDFDDFIRSFGMRSLLRDGETPLDMRMDVSEDDKSYTVKLEIPGAKKEEIQVSIDGNQVIVAAEVRRESKKEEGKQILSERYYGSSNRSFTLPHDVDQDKAQATYENGVLQLVLPKSDNGRARRIAVS